MSKPNILISLEQRHSQNIFSGSKTVELRTRKPNVPPGTTAWIYTKKPIAAIIGHIKIQRIISMPPLQLWNDFGEACAVSRFDFFEYFREREIAHALLLADAKKLSTPATLLELREINNRFSPPQFFCFLDGKKELAHLRKISC